MAGRDGSRRGSRGPRQAAADPHPLVADARIWSAETVRAGARRISGAGADVI